MKRRAYFFRIVIFNFLCVTFFSRYQNPVIFLAELLYTLGSWKCHSISVIRCLIMGNYLPQEFLNIYMLVCNKYSWRRMFFSFGQWIKYSFHIFLYPGFVDWSYHIRYSAWANYGRRSTWYWKDWYCCADIECPLSQLSFTKNLDNYSFKSSFEWSLWEDNAGLY